MREGALWTVKICSGHSPYIAIFMYSDMCIRLYECVLDEYVNSAIRFAGNLPKTMETHKIIMVVPDLFFFPFYCLQRGSFCLYNNGIMCWMPRMVFIRVFPVFLPGPSIETEFNWYWHRQYFMLAYKNLMIFHVFTRFFSSLWHCHKLPGLLWFLSSILWIFDFYLDFAMKSI